MGTQDFGLSFTSEDIVVFNDHSEGKIGPTATVFIDLATEDKIGPVHTEFMDLVVEDKIGPVGFSDALGLCFPFNRVRNDGGGPSTLNKLSSGPGGSGLINSAIC